MKPPFPQSHAPGSDLLVDVSGFLNLRYRFSDQGNQVAELCVPFRGPACLGDGSGQTWHIGKTSDGVWATSDSRTLLARCRPISVIRLQARIVFGLHVYVLEPMTNESRPTDFKVTGADGRLVFSFAGGLTPQTRIVRHENVPVVRIGFAFFCLRWLLGFTPLIFPEPG